MTLEDRIDYKQKCRDQHRGKDLKWMAKQYRALTQQKEELEAKLADINTEWDILRYESMVAYMEENGIDSIKLDGIGRVTTEADIFTGVNNEHKAEFYVWLSDHGFGDIVQPTVNSSTLKAFVKARIKEGITIPGEFVRVTPVTRAKLTKV